ncbi:flagellar hook-length control protein FliK [Paenibacillus paridis]|uniref:flagellar hook-length control protein FliK n=1 Tax=Paenibacillus paridis TaxID=2583376 RepID=UPI001123E0F3|nr:flagellar hook-length control protein FliK [Paenibacillus paridis]
MEMTVSQPTTPQGPVQPGAASQASKNTGGAVFSKTLVKQINGDAVSATGNAQSKPLMATFGKETAAPSENVASTASLSELMSTIDGLLEQLGGASSEGDQPVLADEEQVDQLTAVLDQMNALLALLGIPAPIIQQQAVSSTSVAEGNDLSLPMNVQAASIKSSLQDTLLQLQTMLQQGTTKLIQQQEPSVLVAAQLQALTAILDGEPVDTSKNLTKSDSTSQQLFNVKAAVQQDGSTLLQRLSQQAVHPALIAAAVQNLEQAVDTEAAASPVEAIPQLQPGAGQSETTRGLIPLAGNSAAVPTSFVVADEFAKSMSGMIVQKFDLTTLNGVSEAKLMLFPEHLGQVDVRITMQNGLLTAIFQTDTAMAKDMLDNQMAQLRLALQAQGLMVDKLEVSQGQASPQLSQQQHGQGNGQQHAANRQGFNGEDGSSESQFETEMIEQASIQGLGFGRGLNVKA